jgi:ribosomal protein S18 acetylase RimI-like enzyme
MTIDIVPIERRHIGGFHDVLDSVARERRFLAYTEAPPMAQVRRFVLNNLKSRTVQFVAVDDGRVVGWCDIAPKPRELMRHSGVLGMGVAASHRGQGLGRRLLATTMEAAVAGGLTRIELVVRTDNTAAVGLYRDFGFETEGVCRRYIVVDGSSHDVFLMARLVGQLGPPMAGSAAAE